MGFLDLLLGLLRFSPSYLINNYDFLLSFDP
jgi:hypothetical protein